VSELTPPYGDVGRDADRDAATGRFTRGNRAALVVGNRSAQLWAAQAAARRNIVAEVLADKGHDVDSAPRTLRLAADALAQAVLIQQSAFEKLVETAGPLTSAGRTRRAFTVWQAATDRVEHHLRLIGLTRLSKPAANVAEAFAAMHEEDRA
jgi:hypothetical protein